MKIGKGRFKAYGVVYAADGRVIVDDLNALEPHHRKLVEQEIEKHGRYTHDHGKKRDR